MTIDGREPDGTLWLLQDESCGHILLIPAGEEDVYAWDFADEKRFESEESALAWHAERCPSLNR